MTSQYLTRYAEKEIFISQLLHSHWDNTVIVPIHNEEYHSLLPLIESLIAATSYSNKKVLAIMIVNGKESSKIHNDTFDSLIKNGATLLNSPKCVLNNLSGNLDVLIINRFTAPHEFKEKEGVGLARKIGADLALQLYLDKKVLNPTAYTTDADASVSKEYFAEENINCAAEIFPYYHSYDYEEGEALKLYELSLHYYVLGLRYANSPYAFSTVGSTIAFNLNTYDSVRGFPKLEAGEDFYFLNKLRKAGEIRYRKTGSVKLKGRKSLRVPFGTGAGTKKIHDQLNNNLAFQLYPPQCFYAVKEFLNFSVQTLSDRDSSPLSLATREIVENRKLTDILNTAKTQRKTIADRIRHFHTAFDGFQTLKFIHEARDKYYPMSDYESALNNADFIPKNLNNDLSNLLVKLKEIEYSLETNTLRGF